MTDTRPLRIGTIPTKAIKALLGGLSIVFGVIHSTIWTEFSAGLLDIRSMPRGVRALTLAAIAVMLGMLGMLFFGNALWRTTSESIALTINGQPSTVPIRVLPLMLTGLALGWSFVLMGALRSRRALFVAALLYCLISLSPWLVQTLAAIQQMGLVTPQISASLILMGIGTIGIPTLMVWRRRCTATPLLEYGLLLGCMTLTYAATQNVGLIIWRTTGSWVGLDNYPLAITSLKAMALPALFLVGMSVATLIRTSAGWAGRIAGEQVPYVLTIVAWLGLLLACLWRVMDGLLVELAVYGDAALALACASSGIQVIGIILGCATMLYLGGTRSTRCDTGDIMIRSAELVALPLIVLVNALPMLALLISPISAGFGMPAQATLLNWEHWLNDTANDYWHIALYGLGLVGAIWLARKHHVGLACYLVAVVVTQAGQEIIRAGHPLVRLSWNSPVTTDLWLVLLIAIVSAIWLIRRQLTQARLGVLFAALCITTLIRQTDLIDNPFGPIEHMAGLGGLAFIGLGVLWRTFTLGTWANQTSPTLPRSSRIFLYFGGLLLTLCTVNWALTSNDFNLLNQLTRDMAVAGFTQFGKPMLHAYIIVSLLQR